MSRITRIGALPVVVTLATTLLAGCATDDGHGQEARNLMTPPALPPAPGMLVDLHGFHEGRMRLPEVTSVRHEPDTGLVEMNFVSGDAGQLFIRGRGLSADGSTAVTIAFEVAEHVSPPNKQARRYQSSDDECHLTLAAPLEVGVEVAGTFVCQHVSGERGSREDLAGSFRTGIPLPASGREEAVGRATGT